MVAQETGWSLITKVEKVSLSEQIKVLNKQQDYLCMDY